MNVCVRRSVIPVSLCLLALLPACCFAQNTIRVPGDVPNIQSAIFAAQNGDTVLVAPGQYFESLNFQGKNITVMSSGGAAVTTIDSGFQFAAQFNSNETNSAVLTGFTFINSAGIQIFFSSPVIANNVITGSQACNAGGILASNSSAIIRGNVINGNSQFCTGIGSGGILVTGFGNVQVLNNTITGNHAAPGGQAGGIYVDAQGTTTISGNKIQNNVADTTGGGIYSNGSFVIISDNLITGNSSSAGGGIDIVSGSSAMVINNTVALNTAPLGPQLQIDGTSGSIYLYNNVFYDLTGNGAINCDATGFTSLPVIQNNDVISFLNDPNSAPVEPYTGACADQTGLSGNLQVAPQFVDAANGDFHLLASSPLIDAGSSFAPDLPPLDLDGNPRIAAGSNLCLAAVDIGAYELVFNSIGSANIFPPLVQFLNTSIGLFGGSRPLTVTGTSGCTQITSIVTSPDFPQTNNCSVLRVGDSCTIQLSFIPTLPGVRTDQLKVNLLAPASPLTVELSGSAQNSVTASPTEVKFGVQTLQTSQFQFVSISSLQGQPLLTTGVSLTGDTADFQQFNSCAQFPSNVCSVNIQFSPVTAGPHFATLTVASNLGVVTIPVSGDGAAAVPVLSPASLTFPNQAAGTTSDPQLITLTNDGTADLIWSAVGTTQSYQATAVNCSTFLPAGSSCTFSVTFTPTTIGPISGHVDISTNVGIVSAPLNGTGTAPIAQLNPQSLNFATQALKTTSAPQTISVTNISGTQFKIISLTAPNNFLASSNCPVILDINATCTISVVFDPASSGPYGGYVTLDTTAGTVTATLSVGSNHVFHVPSEIPSIGLAVQLAQDGDTVLVAPGTYVGQVSFQGKAITIASSAGPAVTTLSSQGFGSTVFVFQNEGPASVLKGFTISGGTNSGITISEASPTIQDNIITDNSGCFGAGIQLQFSSAVIKGNTISNNTIVNCFPAAGAGIYVSGPGTVQILNNTITGNQITLSNGFGAGIAVADAAAMITSNIIQNNANLSSFNTAGGGVALFNGGAATLMQNLITGNSSAVEGGGVYLENGAFPFGLINNTIADNIAPTGSNLFVEGFDSGESYFNNIIVDSSGVNAIDCNQAGLFNFSTNDVISVAGGAAYGTLCGVNPTVGGNISQDPQFVNPSAGNYRLQSSSPGIDAGTNVIPNFAFTDQLTLPDHDLDGNGRILPGNAVTCNGTIDLGAYELAIPPSGTPGALPPSWDFGTAPVGTSGVPFVFGLTAQGCVGITSIKTTGDFQQTNTCSGAVSTARSCIISVAFNPQTLGTRNGTLTVDFGPSLPATTVTLTGQAVGNTLGASPASLTFASQAIGTVSAPQSVSVFSPTGLVSVNGIWITGDFTQTNNCSAPLPPTGPCQISVSFAPQSPTSGQGSLNVSTNQGVVSIPLNGSVAANVTVAFSPTSLTFASQLIGTNSAPKTVTMTNTGTGTLSIGSIALVSNGPSDFAHSDSCGTSLPAGASCTITIIFRPLARGVRSASILLTSNATAPPAVTFSGTGLAIQVTPSTSFVAFGGRLVNTVAQQTVTLQNTGDLPASFTGFAITGDFGQGNNCGVSSLAVGATCSITIAFRPTTRGSRLGTLTISGSFTAGPVVINLSGIGQISQISPSPTTLTFADQQVGTTSAIQNVTVTNSGDVAISITSITATGDFTARNGCPASLPTGGSCQVQITFAPTVLGARTGTVVFNTSATTGVAPVNLTGNGVGPNPVFSVPSLSFTPQYVGATSAAQPVTLTNAGTLTLTISSFNLNSDYTQTNNCGVSLAPAASCVVNVSFHPAGAGVRAGTLFVVGNVFGTPPPPVTLSGTGEVIQVTAAPTTLTFGNAILNTTSAAQPVTISNTGDLAVPITAVTITGDFAQTNNCGASLAAGTSCLVNVSFTPTIRGSRTGVLSFTSSAPGTAPNVALSGTGQAITATVSPASLTFAAAPVNTTSAAQAVTFTNAGDAPITITGVTVTGDFAQTNTCGTSLAVGASCAVNVTFTPTVRGARTGSVTLQGNFTTPPPVVSLAGTGQDFVASLTPASADFGNQPVGTRSNPLIFTYTNAGDLPLSVSAIAVNADFSQTNNCPATLAVAASCTITANFTPLTAGAQSAVLTVTGSITSTANVTGTGVVPQASLSPASLNFGHQRQGTASAAQFVTVTNTGAFAFFINSISAPGPYQVTNNCPGLVNPGTSCTLSVVFAPTTSQSGAGALTIGGDFVATPASVSLSGTVDVSAGSLAPGSLAFGNQNVGSSSSQTFTLSSTGNVPINISGIQTTGDFSQSNNCGTAVASGGSCSITVTFSPTVHGARTGTLTVLTDAITALPSVALSGTGTTPTAAWSPASLSFADQLLNTASAAQVVTVTNSGDGPLSISSIAANSATGDFTQTNTCGSTLAAGASCAISVTFRPTATGARTGSLTLASNSSVALSPISLAGNGVAPVAAVSPATLSFSNQAVGTTGAVQTVTLSNSGTAPLTISGIAVSGDFQQSNTCGTTLAAGTSCAISVSFRPTATGSRAGTLTITDNSLSGGVQSVSLGGTGVDFSISASPASNTVNSGKTATYTITLNSLGASFGSPVALSCSGLPSASSCSFAPATLTPGSTAVKSTLQISTTQRGKLPGTPQGTYTITVTGVSGSVQHATTVRLTVN